MDPKPRPVLIVDDDPDMQVFVATILAEGGFLPSSASGEDALRLARTIKPALIVLGAPIHCSSGADLYHLLRTDPVLNRVPVILLSTIPRKSYLHYQRMQESRNSQLLPEPDDFLMKPPEAEELLRRVARLTEAAPMLHTGHGATRPGDRRTSRQHLDQRTAAKPTQESLGPRG